VRLFWPVLLTAAAIGVAGGVFGTFVLLRREALVALALPQVIAAGAAVGMRVGWPTLPPALVAAVVALVYLAFARRRGAGATTLPALYVAGLSLSFLIIANHGQDVADLEHLLTGVDVAVTPGRAVAVAPILLLIAAACGVLWRRWLVLAQAPAAAELAGVHPARWDAAFLALLAAALLLGTDSQGIVMVLALLFLPAATVLPWARRLPGALASAAALSLAVVAVAFVASNVMQWPLSQTVGGVGFAAFAASHAVAFLSGRTGR
jgi:ABC-type Mn2+/Zn2+ transport system permease subunit